MGSAANSTARSVIAGAVGGAIAVVALAAIAACLVRRAGPRMMERMMSGGCCSDEMRACMAKCGCGPAAPRDGDEPAD
jgi:hypothetical protein